MSRTRRLLTFTAGALCLAAGYVLVRVGRRADNRWFPGRVILITGGSRGLGFALAGRLARAGATVIIAARDQATLDRAQARFRESGLEIAAYACDVRDEAQCTALLQTIDKTYGALDVLVNDAGAIEVGAFADQTVDDFREAIETHLFGPLYLTRAAIPILRQKDSARIVNIASVGGLVGVPHLAPYSASKFALVGFSQALAAELAGEDIHVTTVIPGLLRTGSPDHAIFKGDNRAEYAWFTLSDANPLISTAATAAAEQIARAIVSGTPFVSIGWTANVARLANALAPKLVTSVLKTVATLLPPAGGSTRARGSESHSPLAPSLLTALDRDAVVKFNQ